MNKAIFLDRDGVLIEDLKYNCDTNKINICEQIIPFLLELQKKYLLIVITNQSGVARGYFSLYSVKKFNTAMIKKFKQVGITISDIFVCPHLENGVVEKYSKPCTCRKPDTKLITKAQKKYNLDLSKCFMIGDKPSDVQCGKNAKLKNSFNINSIKYEDIIKQIKS